jgi:N-acylneuraminate cytidylyltransferase
LKTLAVIPARGGSTRLKDKNIYPLKGKPLIRWITETVVNSNCFEKVLISTDSDQIFDAVSDLVVERHVRPQIHATTKATVLDAMIDLMQDQTGYDSFAYFLPTCPFVSILDIQKGVKILADGHCDSVVSMTEIPETIQLACLMSQDNSVLPVFDNLEAGLTNSKFIKKYHKPSGAFYMGLWNYLLENKNFFKRSTKGVIVPPGRSVDINTLQDLKYAESII